MRSVIKKRLLVIEEPQLGIWGWLRGRVFRRRLTMEIPYVEEADAQAFLEITMKEYPGWRVVSFPKETAD